jgi:DNA-binding transcriptional ArsR family regulator
MRSPPERVVKHDVRLDILCCLVDGQSLTTAQLSARIGKSIREVGYHVRLLDSCDLVARTDTTVGEQPLYDVTLDEHEDWVREAVEEHRPH